MSTSAETLPFLATLTRGTVYVLVAGPRNAEDLRFEHKKPLAVSAEVRKYLEDHATDLRTVEVATDDYDAVHEHVCKFSFSDNPAAG